MSYIKEADHSEKTVMNAAYDNASNDLVQENNVTVQRKAAVFNLITNVTTQPIQKKAEGESEKKSDLLPGLGDHIMDSGGSADESNKKENNRFHSPPFQLKADSTKPIQRDEPETKEEPKDESPKVKGGIITVIDDNKFIDYSGTYDEIVAQLSNKTESGGILPVVPANINFVENADKKTVSTTFTVKIVKTMPRWTEYSTIKASIAGEKDEKEKDYKTRIIAAWDKVYASLNAHEEEHKKDERKIYTDLSREIQGETQTKAGQLIDAAAETGKTKTAEFHAKKESAILKWPIVEKDLKKVE